MSANKKFPFFKKKHKCDYKKINPTFEMVGKYGPEFTALNDYDALYRYFYKCGKCGKIKLIESIGLI